MGTGRRFRKKPVRRPKKVGCDKTRRIKSQKKRLLAAGLGEASVEKLNSRQVKDQLAVVRKTRRAKPA